MLIINIRKNKLRKKIKFEDFMILLTFLKRLVWLKKIIRIRLKPVLYGKRELMNGIFVEINSW